MKHPNLEWAKQVMRDAKGDRVTEEELNGLCWNNLMGCYLVWWKGMCLGIEKDGHIHS